MTPTKQTVYLPTEEALKEGFSSSDFDRKTGYFFTPEQLNEYTRNVIKQALETAADKAKMTLLVDDENDIVQEANINKQSITDTLEQTYKQFEV